MVQTFFSCLGNSTYRLRRLWLGMAGSYFAFSLLDLVLTWFLVGNGELAYEANPLAAGILQRFGWFGLTFFKMGLVALVLAVTGYLWKRRPRAARFLLWFGCGSSLVVVSYSASLLADTLTDNSLAILEKARGRYKEMEFRRLEQKRFFRKLNSLAHAIVEEKYDLAQATTDLVAFMQDLSYDPSPYLRCYFGNIGLEACLAAQIVREVGFQVADNPVQARRFYCAMCRQFETFAHRLPDYSRTAFSFNPDLH